MADRILVSAVGAVVEIDGTSLDDARQARVRTAWADALLRGDRPADVVVTPSGDDDERMLSLLSTEVTLAALEHRRGEAWMLHAAGLADERGHVVVLVAPSGTGKTTAAKHLAARLAYVSDETVAIDSQGGVTAYRKPLSIIPPGGGTKQQVPPSTFEKGVQLPANLRLSKIVVLDRDADGPAAPRIEQLDVAEALALLAPQSSYLCDARSVLRTIDAVIRATGGVARLRYREIETVDALIDELIDSVPAWDPLVASPRAERSEADAPAAAGEYFRGTVVDALPLDDGRLALLQREATGGRFRVLDGIAPALWRAAAGVGRDVLRTAVVAEHGEPEGVDVDALIDQALETLVADGILSSGRSWSIADDAAWTTDEQRSTVLDLGAVNAQPLVLEGSSHVIWSILADRLALSERALLDECAAVFDIDVDAIADDVVSLLWRLRDEGLVDVV